MCFIQLILIHISIIRFIFILFHRTHWLITVKYVRLYVLYTFRHKSGLFYVPADRRQRSPLNCVKYQKIYSYFVWTMLICSCLSSYSHLVCHIKFCYHHYPLRWVSCCLILSAFYIASECKRFVHSAHQYYVWKIDQSNYILQKKMTTFLLLAYFDWLP